MNRTKRAAVVGFAVVAVVVAAWLAIALVPRGSREARSPGPDPALPRAGASVPGTAAEPAPPRSLYSQRNVARRRIAGRVSFDGKPVAHARVALRWAGMDSAAAAPAPTPTDASGHFDLGPWFAERFTVTAVADGKTAAVVETDLRDPTAAPPSDQLELILSPCTHTLVGTVVDGSGGPIAGAAVGRVRSIPVATARDGSYALCLPAGRNAISVTADGYGSVVLTVELHGKLRRDIALVPAGAIRGTITRQRDGAPVADALVSAWPLRPGPDHAAEALAHSDAAGRFRLAGLAPGRFTVWGSTGQLVGSAVVVVVPTGAAEVTIALSDFARVDGRVLASGRPVAGARVFARSTSRSGGSRAAISQLDGGFTLDEVPLGTITLSAPPYQVIAPARLDVDRPELSGVVLEVVAMASISGRVIQDGQPVAGAAVQTTPDQLQELSAAGGEYKLRGLKPGTYSVHAETTDGAASPPQPVTVKAGEQRTNLDLDLTSRASIAGVVVDQAGRPVRDAVVAWTDEAAGDSRRTTTDDLGRFVVGKLRGGGTYRPTVRPFERDAPLAFVGPPPELRIDPRRPERDGVELDVQVDRLVIAGRVIDDAGIEVADARVDAIAAPRDGTPVFHSWLRIPSSVSGADGRFSIGGLATGSYAVRARGADDREAIVSPVDAGAREVTLQLASSAAIEVALAGFSTTPTVDAENARGDFQKFYGKVDGSHARITGLLPGRYIVAAHNTAELDAVAVSVAAGATASVALTSHGSGRLTGTVRSFVTGAPVADMECLVFPTASGMLGAEPAWDISAAPSSDAQGQFVIDPAPAGPSAIYCYNPAAGMSSARAFVDLARGERATAQLYTVHLDPPAIGDIGADLDQGFPITVTSVRDGGPAAVAGVRAGDRLVALDGRAIDQLSKGGVLHWIDSHKVGARISLTVQRGTDVLTFAVVVSHTLVQPN